MFGRKKPKKTPKRRPAPESSGMYKKPSLSEDQTATLRILLGDADLEIAKDSEEGGDPHDNSGRYPVAQLDRKR
jgi:hypothetical protein